MSKTKVIDAMVTSGNLSSEYLLFIKKNKNNPIVLLDFLHEIDDAINKLRRCWLLETFDSSQKSSKANLNDQLNLGIVLTNCQLQGYELWNKQIALLNMQLIKAKAEQDRRSVKRVFVESINLGLYKKSSKMQMLESQIKYAIEQRDLSLNVAHSYFSILESLNHPMQLSTSYPKDNISLKSFIINLLSSKNGISIMHLASIYCDDKLVARALQLLRKHITCEESALLAYNLMISPLSFFHDPTLKNHHNNTIGHCISKNTLSMQESLHELLLVFSTLLKHGITATLIRKLFYMPIDDILSENIKNFISKYYAALNQETKTLFVSINDISMQDAHIKDQDAITPILFILPTALQQTVQGDPLSSWRYYPIFVHTEVQEETPYDVPITTPSHQLHTPEPNSEQIQAPMEYDVPSFMPHKSRPDLK